MIIRSQFEKHIRYSVPSGSKFIELYQEQIENGVKTLKKTGLKNVWEEIQAGLEESKIENILHAVAMGDLSALNAREGSYMDSTTMPKTLMEAQNLVLKMKSEFETMPTEVKNQFNNSADKYVEMMGTEEFNKIMSPYNEQVAKIAAEKNHKEYLKKVQEGAKLNYDIAKEQKALELKEGGNN